jgi:hypothetical protein
LHRSDGRSTLLCFSPKREHVNGPIYRFLADDHRRLDTLLRQAQDLTGIDRRAYDAFRVGILTHIAMEEKVLLPAMRLANENTPLAIAGRLRVEHGAIAAVLVPTPTAQILGVLRSILDQHNPIEEGVSGLYETCDQLPSAQAEAILDRLRHYPQVRIAPNNDGARVLPATRRALERAGFRDEAAQLGS